MSGRRANSNANRIRGPQSALTDFLAANNISAQQIRNSYEQRTRTAGPPTSTEGNTPQPGESAVEDQAEVDAPAPEPSKKRKRADEKSKAKLKASKKSRDGKGKGPDDESDDEILDSLGREMYKKAHSLPGQLENCEICEKRFTVTAYSKTGAQGGLVCMPCGRELAKDQPAAAKKVKKAGTGKVRRKTESNRLDGIVSAGPKTLQQLCVEKVADHHLDIDEFGDLPDSVLNRLSEIFARRRVLDPRTFRLFLRPGLETVAIHDCAKLEIDDYKLIFAVVPNVSKVILRNASQFKDAVMQYMIEKATNITHFQLYAGNLISNDMWKTFFIQHGHKLETLKLQSLDAAFDDEVVDCMVQHCPNLRRLKFKFCRQITSASLPTLVGLRKLSHLSIHFSQPPEAAQLVSLITALGPMLETLSLENCTETDDSVIDEIRAQCGQLRKFRLTNIDCVTDAALASLFSQTSIVPPLEFLDLSSARDVDNNNSEGPLDAPVGLASDSFKALMTHSGSRLQVLHIPSCRHISHAAFCDVFGGVNPAVDEATKRLDLPVFYPELREMDLSFCSSTDTAVMNGIFKTCPNLKKLVAFGCFKVEEVVVPKGLVLVGLPRAQDQIEQFGDAVAGGGGIDGVLEGLMAMDEMPGMAGRSVEVGA